MTDTGFSTASSNSLSEGLWASQLADKVLAEFPDQPVYTCAAGISPSGIVHFGNFRDVITAFAVGSELKARGRQVRFLFSWDNFDRFRKVPVDVDPSFGKYIGLPLTSVPDPEGGNGSYAEHFQAPFEASIRSIGMTLDYKYQTDEYRSGRYADNIALALQKRLEIAEILLSFKTEKGNQEKGIDPETFRTTYYPVSLYSRFTGKDKTEILDYDGGSRLTYRCTESGKSETIDFRIDPIVKLQWKIDWAMRWRAENVNFEPAGKDHASPGGSYDTSSVIARTIFSTKPPVFQGYEFVGIQGIGGKMSGSKGGAVSPAMLLEIYEPELLKWLYLRRIPTQSFNLAFDTEIYRQYDEFDRSVSQFRDGTASPVQARTLEVSGVKRTAAGPPIAFKQAVALGQITQWNAGKLGELVGKLGVSYDAASLAARLPKAAAWLERYNPDEVIKLMETKNTHYLAAMDADARTRVAELRTNLTKEIASVADLEEMVYAIPKNPSFDEKATKTAQRQFFKDVYNLLIGKDAGPRLSTFLWAVDRDRILALLDTDI